MLISFLTFLSLSFNNEISLVGENYRILDDKFNNGFPQSQYEKIIAHVDKIYGPIIKNQGGELHILADWSDGAVNMWAERLGDEYWLEIPGGMARYELINEAAFMISICHELGHLLGGDPKNGQISFEGQSDYFANQECSKLLLDQWALLKKIEFDLEVNSYCQGDPLCKLIMQGSKSLTAYYAELEGKPYPQIGTATKKEVSATLQTHPDSQCRLDTLVASFHIKPRPRCWYTQ